MASQSQILRRQSWRAGFENGHNEGWKSGLKFGLFLGTGLAVATGLIVWLCR